jgi:hypothetical protein
MMSSIREMITSLQSLKADISDISSTMQRECEYINETVSKVHSDFGDQPSGQKLAISLHKAMLQATFADSALYRVGQGIDNATEMLRK